MKSILVSIALLALAISQIATAEDVPQENDELAATNYTHEGKQYPPVFFVTNLDDNNAFGEHLASFAAFTELNKDSLGLPIGLRVIKAHRTKADGTSVSTGLLAASTLGIIPVVSSTEFKVRYDVFVQGDSIAEFEYEMSSTKVDNIWNNNPNKKAELKPAEQLFLENSANLFLADLKKSKEVQAVFSEYFEYFPNE